MTSPDAQEARQAAERTLTVLDDLVQAVVQQALDEVADDVASLIRDAAREELQAALDATTLRQIIRLWRRRLPRVLAALLAVVEAAVRAVLRRFGAPMPPDWEDLPGRWADDPFSVPDRVRQYVSTAENRLAEVGDRLWEAARDALREGNDEGEGIDQLARRLRRVFAEDGAELGRARAERIARTEVVSAWNRASLDASSAMPESARPPYKAWVATIDTRTRPAHWAADGQIVPVAAPFIVGGEPLMTPGDPIGSPDNVINCRCTFILTYTQDVPEDAGRQFLDDDEIAEVIAYFEREHGIVREAHRSALTAASGGPYTGGMVALVPSQADIDRLAVPDGELPEDLHLTLLVLGDAEQITGEMRARIIDGLGAHVAELGDTVDTLPIKGHGFAISAFNPGSSERDTALVLGVGGEDLGTIQAGVAEIVRRVFAFPEQHAPWVPHVTLTYTDDLPQLITLADRTGPIVFDRLRVAFGDDITDIPLTPAEQEAAAVTTDMPAPRAWSTPGDTALAWENQQTGDGRIFAPGSLYWDGPGPWPLQYADEMLTGHEGAELAGAITTLARDGDRIPGAGVLYPSQASGAAAIRLLEEGAPLGVSVDLDDVDVELIDRRPPEERDDGEDEVVLLASLAAASILPLADGGHLVRATHVTEQTASGRSVRASHTVEWAVDPRGGVPAADLHAALTASGIITAAAGDADDTAGQVVMAERSGDMVMRITRGRVRGATLVSMPAFAQARITLDPMDGDLAAAGEQPPAGRMRDVVTYVASSPTPVGATQVADALAITTSAARNYLTRAAAAGYITRLARGLYVAASTIPEGRAEVVAAMSGDLDLPIHPERDAEWDGDAAASRVLEWATGEDSEVDAGRLGRAFLWRDPDADPATLAAYKLGIADLYQSGGEERLEIVPRAVFAVAGVLQGARGGADIPDEEQTELRYRVSRLYRRLGEEFDERLVAPWDEEEDDMDDLEASAWSEFQAMPPLPAAWFAEPTEEELPTDQGPVHVTDDGRVYGWVAQRGVCHDGYTGQCVTIDQLGDVDTSYFLRSRVSLDDGSQIRVGVFTMNAGHDNDGTDAASTRALFDNTRTVAGIVTVGTNAHGMWFSGAAAPWLSEWDRAVFSACAPSGHWRRDRGGRWSLRAVLSVPVPGYPTRLAASAVARANLALTASAAPRPGPGPVSGVDLDALAAALAPAVADELERRQAARKEVERLAAELAPVRAEIAASMAAQIKGGI